MFSQLTKLFTKHVNRVVESDFSGKQLTKEEITDDIFEFYFDKVNDTGYIKVTENKTGKKWRMELKEMYTGLAKGLKIYYFQSSDGKFKVSASKEEMGLAIASYAEKKMTVFYYK